MAFIQLKNHTQLTVENKTTNNSISLKKNEDSDIKTNTAMRNDSQQ